MQTVLIGPNPAVAPMANGMKRLQRDYDPDSNRTDGLLPSRDLLLTVR